MMMVKSASLHGGVVKLPTTSWWIYEEEEADNDGDEDDTDAKCAVSSSLRIVLFDVAISYASKFDIKYGNND